MWGEKGGGGGGYQPVEMHIFSVHLRSLFSHSSALGDTSKRQKPNKNKKQKHQKQSKMKIKNEMLTDIVPILSEKLQPIAGCCDLDDRESIYSQAGPANQASTNSELLEHTHAHTSLIGGVRPSQSQQHDPVHTHYLQPGHQAFRPIFVSHRPLCYLP